MCSVCLLHASSTRTVFCGVPVAQEAEAPCAVVHHLHRWRQAAPTRSRHVFPRPNPDFPPRGFCGMNTGSMHHRVVLPRSGTHSVEQGPTWWFRARPYEGTRRPLSPARLPTWHFDHVLHSHSEPHLLLASTLPFAFRFCTNLQFFVIFYLSFLHG